MKSRFTEKEHINSGLAFILIFLIGGIGWNFEIYFTLALVCVLVLLIKPVILYPFTYFWLNLSDVLGKIISRILLAIVFYLIVLPAALVRKSLGKDILLLKHFKKSDRSVFVERNHLFDKHDLVNTF